ncbi:PREDICTED: mitochondrial GTPase 1-like isoform X2 [Priapulus caudatus]|uniref:Mitochondrial GTPase 1 n=1 Tax=Priapulus caudatus TaxID=37621 RepID=A0ABM1ECS8_PRICU|nr:PREDICTED: mitochondrial GTPase 1-like isoform X2 [Priapulus caudatus]
MQAVMKNVDCIIEVHDSRIPFSGRNSEFEYTIGGRPKILILNKILPSIQELIHDAGRYHRAENRDYNVLVCGVPNVGKSSLTNAIRHKYLRAGKATQVGPTAGVTRSVLEKIRVCDEPLTYILDTPGVLAPNVRNVEVGMKLALCATLQDHLVGETIIADYLLYWMNRHRRFEYVEHFGLKEPTDNITELLVPIAIHSNKIQKIRTSEGRYEYKPNISQAARVVMAAFRTGKLGKFMLDDDALDSLSEPAVADNAGDARHRS